MSKTLNDMIEKLCPQSNKKTAHLLSPFYEKERNYLTSMFRATVLGNESGIKTSNSVIVYGPPGCGKTTFIEGIIQQLTEETKGFAKVCKVVRLNGHICSTWRQALSEMCYQLSIDTLLNNEGEKEHENVNEYLEQVFVLLKDNIAKYEKSIIFILDNLELFADSRQALLYNLFDLRFHNSSVPVCIVGVTCCVEVMELFERRVSSRFSHRQINLLGHFDTFAKYSSCALQLLQHSKDKKWNLNVLELCESSKIKSIFQTMYDSNKSLTDLVNYLYTVLLVVDHSLTEVDFQTAFKHKFPISSKVQMVLDLPVGDLLPLVAMFKYMQNNDQMAMQAKALYNTVERVARSFSITRVTFMETMRRIQTLGLIEPVKNTIQSDNNSINSLTYFKTNLSTREFRDIWSTYPNLPTDFQESL